MALMGLTGGSRLIAAENKTPPDFKSTPIDGDVLKTNPDARWKKLLTGNSHNFTIDQCRQTFWDTYPDHPANEAAREEFAQQLYVKDMLYLQANLYLRVIDSDYREMLRKHEQNAMNDLLKYMGADIDGGIPRQAEVAFMDWVDETTRRLGPARRTDDIFKKGFAVGLGVLSPTFRDAANFSGKEYQAYLRERDWAEFDRAGRIPAGYDNPHKYGIYLYCRIGQYPFNEARATWAGFVEVMGKQSAEDAAEKVRTAKHVNALRLETHVPRPVKLGPGGSEVDDYDMPYPPGVIDVYSGPLQAMEMQATEGNDEHYVLKLLSARFLQDNYFSPALREKSGTNKWLWAGSLLKAMNNAFTPQAVADAAHAVHTAKQRLITGSVINQQALGAGRNEPVECLEDILCRKNPRGYLMSAIAMKQKPFDPGSVDLNSAYQTAMSQDDEKALLASATRMAGEKPHLAYRLELDSIKAGVGRPQVVEKSGPMVDYPPYLDWKRFPVGAQVAYVQRLWLSSPTDYEKLTPRGWPDLKYMYTVKEVTPEQVSYWHTEQVFDSKDGAAHPPRDTEMAYGAKVPAAAGNGSSARTPDEAKYLAMRMGRGAVDEPVIESGQETLVVGGRQLKCNWTSETVTSTTGGAMVKTWTCDQIPGGLVRKLVDQVYRGDRGHPPSRSVKETYLASFKGFSPGEPAADPKQTLPPPGPPAAALAALAALLPKPTPQQPIVHSNFNPNMRGNPTTAPAGKPRAGQVSEAQVALRQRYQADMTRFRQDLIQVGQKRRDAGTIPDDVREAQAAVAARISAVGRAMATRDDDQTAKALDDFEQSLAALEERLK
jgi:hypothetical protein